VVGEGGHLLRVVEAEFAGGMHGSVEHPDAELRELVELDFVAIEEADVVEAGEFLYETVNKAIAVVVELWRTRAHKVVEVAVVFVRQDFADLVEDGELFIEHGHLDVGLE